MESGESKLDALLNQCKSNDVDVKIDALTKIQVEAESGIEINDSDALINVLKACLRTSNQHLTTATLNAFPPILPLLISRPVHLSHQRNGSGAGQPSSVHSSTSSSTPSSVVDAFTLRQVLNAFLPSGGLFERLGDKEKAQIKARETLVILGGFAFRSSGSSTLSTGSRGGKGPETPLAMYERFLRDSGFGSKAWKLREQTILTLVHIRRKYHTFPIRPYLPSLVDCLEDTDAHVRDCARQSVIELFSGPAVTDAARADLKKEMAKKNVRKTIVESVLSKLLGGDSGSNPQSREGSENGDSVSAKPKEYVPPSLALQGRKPSSAVASMSRTASATTIPRPASRAAVASPPLVSTLTAESASDVNPVYIASARDLENEFAGMAKAFEGKETEHNWAARDQYILRVRGMLKGDVHQRYFDAFMACLKDGFIQWSTKTLASLRTTVATNTCFFYQELAVTLGHGLDPFCETLLSNLLKMAGFTKKITAQLSQASVSSLITHTSGLPRLFIPLLWQCLQEKTVQARTYAIDHFRMYLEVHGLRAKSAIEASGGLEILDKAMKKALGDPTPAVRTNARTCFWIFYEIWGDRGAAILESLDAAARKQLEKACPKPVLVTSLPPSTPTAAKKSSVAAAIAASRAKAKAIATAPPTLRHQATSAVPVSRRAGSPILSKSISQTPRPSSPLRSSASPPSPRSRILVNGMQRSVSTASAPVSHARSYSGNSVVRPISPPSPTAEHSFGRRISSPLATDTSTRPSTIRKAMQTALPASPPESTTSLTVPKSAARAPPPVSVPARLSTILPRLNTDEDSLLLAQAIPIPDDSDSEHSVNLMSFSTPFEKYPPPPASNSQTHSISPRSTDFKPMIGVSNALSTDSVTELAQTGGAPVVEDALRARAEQAESAAERLLELVEPDEDGTPLPSFPPSLLVGNRANGHVTPKGKSKPSPMPVTQPRPPITPINRAAAVMRQAALFTDSPANNGKPTSLLDVLQDRRNETGWWLKRKTFLAKEASVVVEGNSDQEANLQSCITSLEQDTADTAVLKKLVLLSLRNPSIDVLSPLSPDSAFPISPTPFASSHSMTSLHYDIWEKNKNFDRLFNALTKYLVASDSDSDIEYGLMVIWQMLESQAVYLEGKEADIFSLLLHVRFCNKFDVLEATNTIRDTLTARIEPVYGLTVTHASLRTFQTEPTSPGGEDAKSASYAFGLIALGKFVLRLPAEIAEEEIPRLRATFISALNDTSSLVVREAAAAAIIAAQLVLRDETHLFVLLDGLADEKKNLLTYLFDKHGARGASQATGLSGFDKLEKEMRRLDTRTSTPPRRHA